MGNHCSGQACCTGEPRDSEISVGRIDQYLPHSQDRISGIQTVQLHGTRGVPARIYTREEILKIVHLQACARRFLTQRLI